MNTRVTNSFKSFVALLVGVWNAGTGKQTWLVSYWKNFTESGSRGIKSSEWVSEQMKEHLERALWGTDRWSGKNQLLDAVKIKFRFVTESERIHGSQGLLPAECARVRFLNVFGESHRARFDAVKVDPSRERSGIVPD